MSRWATCLPLLISLVASLVGRAQPAPEVVPPRVLAAPPASAPLTPNPPGGATVVLRVLVGVTGAVEGVDVLESGGAELDQAATAAVRLWRFAPATRAGTPVAVRVRIPFVFEAPPRANQETDAGEPPAPPSGSASASASGSEPPADAGAPLVVALPAPVESESAPLPPGVEEVDVRGQQRKVERGGSDFQIEVGQLATIAGQSPESLLELAPGIFIANEGGAGHADQVFLRGFDAEQGQNIEFTVNGVPINQVDNTDGHGYADTHFIIPELVKNLRVIEGPFDPHQGDFAEAGSVDYELGVPHRQLMAQVQYGSFNTERALALWAPEGEREGTFAAVQATQSDGYGTNRANSDASAMAQYEGELGSRGLWRLLGTAYATHYRSAGVVRADDVANGIVDYYGTEDPSQGGDAQHFSISLQLIDPTNDGTLTQQLFLIYNGIRILEDFTGFLLDPQLPGQSEHPQRGDGILQQYESITAGGRGSYRLEGKLFGQSQAIEAGYFARYDHTTPVIQRVKFGTDTPYEYDEDLVTDIFNLAGYLDFELHPVRWLTLRGGLRQEYFDYNVQNLCALPNEFVPRSAILDVACGTSDAAGGVRLPDQRASATALITEPKVTALVQLPVGFALTGSVGEGAQSLDATNIMQDEQAPFSQILAAEGGGLFHRRLGDFDTSARALYFYTHVGQDLAFDPNQGRLTLGTGTTRQGVVAAVRLTGGILDESASFTYAYATNDNDGTLVPYVPSVVARSDTVVTGRLPLRFGDHAVQGGAGVDLSFVGDRALPLGQNASPTFVVGVSGNVRWDLFQLNLSIQNLFDAKYPLSEFFYASDFHHAAYPTLTPVEHFTAAPPLSVMVGLAVILDKESRP